MDHGMDFFATLLIFKITKSGDTVGKLSTNYRNCALNKRIEYSVAAIKVGDEAYAIELSGKNNDWLNVNGRIEKFNKIISETNEEIKNYLNSSI